MMSNLYVAFDAIAFILIVWVLLYVIRRLTKTKSYRYLGENGEILVQDYREILGWRQDIGLPHTEQYTKSFDADANLPPVVIRRNIK